MPWCASTGSISSRTFEERTSGCLVSTSSCRPRRSSTVSSSHGTTADSGRRTVASSSAITVASETAWSGEVAIRSTQASTTDPSPNRRTSMSIVSVTVAVPSQSSTSRMES
jgi:hypothetical protein